MLMRKFILVFVGLFSLMFFVQQTNGQSISEGINYLELDKFANAGKVFKTLASSKPSGENYYYLGYYYMNVEELDSAKMQFEKGIAQDAKYGLNYVGLGSLLLQKGNKTGAKEQFELAKKMTKSKNADVFFRIGEAYIAHAGNTDPVEAVTNADMAVKLNKNLADAFVVIGDAALLKLDGTTAANNYDKALALNANLLKTHIRLGNLFLRSKNLPAARDKYNEAITANASYSPAYRQLAELYYLAKQYPKAIENMEKYISLADRNPSTMFRYAGFLILVGKHKEAMDILATLKQHYSNGAIYNRLMAYGSYETQQCSQGMDYINKFFTLAKPEAVIAADYEYLGKLQMCTGKDTTEAIKNIVKASEIDSNKVEILKDLAQKFGDAKKPAAAIQMREAYISKAGSKVTTNDHFYLGVAYFQTGNFVKAESLFQTVVTELAKKDPTNLLGYQWLAKAKAKQDVEGTAGTAEETYQKFFDMAAAETDTKKADSYKRELLTGYYYMAVLNLKKYKSITKAHEYANKMLAIDPQNKAAKQVLSFTQSDLESKPAAGTGTSKPASTGTKPAPKTPQGKPK